jgi:hypothetical protein
MTSASLMTIVPSLLLSIAGFLGSCRALYFLVNNYRSEIVVGEMVVAALCLCLANWMVP